MPRPLPPETWGEIERAYVETDEEIRAIAARFSIAVATIYKRAAKCGWPRRRKKGQADVRAAIARQTLGERLFRVMIKKLEQLETRMESNAHGTAADREREMREIGAVVRGFEKVKELGAGDRNGQGDDGPSRVLAAHDAERIRHEIAERLERLYQRWNTARKPG